MDDTQTDKIETNFETRADSPPAPVGWGGRFVRLFLFVVIIAVGILGANHLQNSAPKARKRPPAKMRPLVQVVTVQPADQQVAVSAMGTVVPARELVLKSRVGGEVVALHPEFAVGGLIRKGELVLRIDSQDYRLTLSQKKKTVSDAEYALKLEMGRQGVAKREWQLLNKGQTTGARDGELALRKPHLAKAKADLTAAKAEVRQANLNLSRTKVSAPINAVIRAKLVEKGSQITAQEKIAELVGTDAYWVQVSVPVDRLEWISIPRENGQRGSSVTIYHRGRHERRGTVIKLLSDIETAGRMARVLVEVKDPLNLNAESLDSSGQNREIQPLLIGEYVRVSIAGRRLKQVFRIPRTALHDGSKIWLADERGNLEIRAVAPLWRDPNSVLLKQGLKPGERLIVSELSTPVAGMPVNIDGPGRDRPASKKVSNPASQPVSKPVPAARRGKKSPAGAQRIHKSKIPSPPTGPVQNKSAQG